jgi:pimeloyl-ACP methyl ester carboxylesterase
VDRHRRQPELAGPPRAAIRAVSTGPEAVMRRVKSPPPKFPSRLFMLARLSRKLLDELGIGQVDVMGVSWGGGLAQQFAIQYPKRVRRLVLAATAMGPPAMWLAVRACC